MTRAGQEETNGQTRGIKRSKTTAEPEVIANDGHTRRSSKASKRRSHNAGQVTSGAATEKPDHNRPLHIQGPAKKRRRKNLRETQNITKLTQFQHTKPTLTKQTTYQQHSCPHQKTDKATENWGKTQRE